MEENNLINNDRASLISQLFEQIDQQPKIEFTAVVYAVLENEQKVEVQIKRTGPIDTDIRFRCLYSLSHAFIHIYAIIQQYGTAAYILYTYKLKFSN